MPTVEVDIPRWFEKHERRLAAMGVPDSRIVQAKAQRTKAAQETRELNQIRMIARLAEAYVEATNGTKDAALAELISAIDRHKKWRRFYATS